MTVTWTKIGTTKYVSGPNGGNTGTIDTTASGGAKLFVVYVSWYNAVGEPTLTDSVGGGINSYPQSHASLTSGILSSRLYVCTPAQNSASMSWNLSGSGNVPSCYVDVWTNNAAGSIVEDQYASRAYSSSVQSNTFSGTTTNSVTDALGISGYGCGAAGTITVDSSFTLDQNTDHNGGVTFGGGIASFQYSSAVAKNPTLSWTSANIIDDKTAAFVILKVVVLPLALNEFEDHCIIPTDNGLNTAAIACSGPYDSSAGTPASIELELRAAGGGVLQAYTALSSPSFGSGGSWNGTFTGPLGTDFVARVRTKNGIGTILETSSITTNPWAVSDTVIGCIGQSNLVQMNAMIASPPAANAWGRTFDGTTFASPTGNGCIGLLNALIAARAGTGIGGTDIAALYTLTGLGGVGVTIGDGSPGGYWLETTSPSNAFQLFKTLCNNLRGSRKVNYVLDCGGSTDAIFAVSYSDLYAGTQTLRSNTNTFFSLTSAQLPWLIIINGRDDNGGDSNAEWQTCKDVDIDFGTTETNAHIAATLTDEVLFDNYHAVGASYGHVGVRVAQTILKLKGLQTYDGASVSITGARRIFGSPKIFIYINLNGGTVLNYADTTTSGVGQVGWQVSSDNFATTLTISSTAFQGNLAVLTLSAAPADGDAVKIRYLYGKNSGIDVTKIDYNNVFPLSDSLQIPLLPSSSNSPVSVLPDKVFKTAMLNGLGAPGGNFFGNPLG